MTGKRRRGRGASRLDPPLRALLHAGRQNGLPRCSFDRRCQRTSSFRKRRSFLNKVRKVRTPMGKKFPSRGRRPGATAQLVRSTISKSEFVQEKAAFPEQVPEIPHPHGKKF